MVEPDAPPRPKRWSRGRLLFLVVTAICLYLFLPSLVEVFTAWNRLGEVRPLWLAALVACEVLSFVCVWILQGITLQSNNAFAIINSHLAGNAFNRITPGGGATGTALQARMLADAGFDVGTTISALTAWSALSTITVVALPVFAIPAMIGGTQVPHQLRTTALIGAGVFLLLLAAGAVFLGTRRPVELFAQGLEWVLRHVRPPHAHPPADFSARVFAERDMLRRTLGARWPEALTASIARWAFDFLALLLTLVAIRAHPDPPLVLLAFAAVCVLGLIPLTPGGIGFVEAGLTGTLVLAGVHGESAVLATLVYRLVSFWLPLPVGVAAAWAFRRRYPRAAAIKE
jgi:uncharacterized protein (TIRG00374 family)